MDPGFWTLALPFVLSLLLSPMTDVLPAICGEKALLKFLHYMKLYPFN